MTDTYAATMLNLKPGDRLPNGATLVVYRYNPASLDGVVLAKWEKAWGTEWIVWSVYRHDARSTGGGDYCRSCDEARAGFDSRASQRGATVVV